MGFITGDTRSLDYSSLGRVIGLIPPADWSGSSATTASTL